METLNSRIVLLVILIVITFLAFYKDGKDFDRFTTFEDTYNRNKFFRKWTIEPFVLYGLSAIIILFFIGEISSINSIPNFLKEFANSIRSTVTQTENRFLSGLLNGLLLSTIPILLFGGTIGTILKEYSIHKNRDENGNPKEQSENFRKLEFLIPRNYGERIWGALLSINAGFSEELFFRILAPILIYSVTGSALIAIIGSTLWFGCAHYYQGVFGIVVTFFVGLLLFLVYLISSSIWVTMLIHAVIDLNGLVLGPWLKEKFSTIRT